MMNPNLKSLVSKLTPFFRGVMESAAGLCISHGHYEIDVEHLLHKTLERDNSDIHKIFYHYGIDISRFEGELNQSLRSLKTGNTRNPVLAIRLPKLLSSAWLIASIDYAETQIRSGHFLLALLADSQACQQIKQWSYELTEISVEDLRKNFDAITTASGEAFTKLASSHLNFQANSNQRIGKVATPGLDQYTVSLTERARAGQLDPVLERDDEIRQIIDILLRRRQNNPILTGEAGVGKTAVVEGLALRIIANDVPKALRGVELHMLDLGLLQAGASVKGEFENRLKSVIEETKASLVPIILFIDEAHTLIGAGGQAGQNDAANLLKPALARGELRTVAATTWSEYKKYFEKDAALARRFQVVKVNEPTEEQAVLMLRGMLHKMQQHHQVRILDEALLAAVKLSHRYITGRQLPDKAVSVLDTACARVALGGDMVPSEVENKRRYLESIQAEIQVLHQEMAVGADHQIRVAELTEELQLAQIALAELESRWQRELICVQKIRTLQAQLEQQKELQKQDLRKSVLAGRADEDSTQIVPQGGLNRGFEQHAASLRNGLRMQAQTRPARVTQPGRFCVSPKQEELDRQTLLVQLEQARADLSEIQNQHAVLVPVCVDEQNVAAIISAWTGVPLGKMLQDELDTICMLKATLAGRVIGQDHALEMIAQRIHISRANLEDPNKPIAVFMLVGPSGVGKTETALALAEILYGGERNLITINLSEFQEAYTVSSLKGSPPGYVGYGEGGILTEAVRRKPYSVVLLDEIEKAHPDVLELFFQVFDKGVMDDAEGREINFKNTVILLTSNIGTETIMQSCQLAEVRPSKQQLIESLHNDLNHAFKPAFIGRLQVIPYYPVKDEILKQIIRLKLEKIKQRVVMNHHAILHYDEPLIDWIAARCTEVDSGARNIDNILTRSVLPKIAQGVLEKLAQGLSITTISLKTAGKEGLFDCQVS